MTERKQMGPDAVSHGRWRTAQEHEADFWKRSNPLASMPRLVRWHGPAIKAASLFLPEDARIVEIGSGPTCTARLFDEGTKVYTDPLMHVFKQHMGHIVPEGAALAAAGEALPFADASFDAALCVAALDHAMSAQQCLTEMARVLKPGGRLILGIHTHNALLLGLRRSLERVVPSVGSAPHPSIYTLPELRADLSELFEIEAAERVHQARGVLAWFHREYWVFTACCGATPDASSVPDRGDITGADGKSLER